MSHTDFYTKVGWASGDDPVTMSTIKIHKGLTDDDMIVMSHIFISSGAMA